MLISIGGDHAGYALKSELRTYLLEKGYETDDLGPFSAESVDYPDFAHPVARQVESGKADFGILICGSANGVAMTANKHEKIRAAIAWKKEIAELARQHNDANILCLPARYITLEEAKEMVDVFIATPFEGGRHERRVEKIAC
ncbi:MAG: sugar-phosphate isomerase, RpiB/LacA/LacB family [Bacteroidetes bacterium]|nr:sugar-phosphate isomerase, RpiB/LacA/LacB family [Bacteroidota bacterium]